MRPWMFALLLLPVARADEATCGPACPARGLELVIVEEPVPLTGFTVEQVSEAWQTALGERAHSTPRLSGWQPCYKCGSTEVLDGATLRYELKVPVPKYGDAPSLSDADRRSIQKWIAAVQGHVFREVAAHRDALEKVPVRNASAADVLHGAQAACVSALEAVEALDQAEGCISATTAGGVTMAPIDACPGRHRAPKPALCEIAP